MHSVRPNVSALLDVARQTWNDAMERLHSLYRAYAVSYPEMTARLEFTERRGWYISHAAQNAPQEFLRTAQKGTSGRQMSTTRELNSLNFKLRQAEREILLQTLSVLSSLYEALRQEAPLLHRVSHAASTLDLAQAFAGYALLLGQCVRPELSEATSAPIAVKAGRHPLRERALSGTAPGTGFEPLDFFVGEDCHFQAVTGRNGGGKSTYLQTLAQLVVLAQIGCHIPAQYAMIRIVTSLFTRIGSSDNIEASASTFLVEMQQAAHILRDVMPESLVLVDELGRGTAHADGISICWAICERLLEMRVYTLFATHFFEVCRLQAVVPGFRNMHIQDGSAGQEGRGQFAVHRVTSLEALLGKPLLRYGLRAAGQAGLPDLLVSRARTMAARLGERLVSRLPYGPRAGSATATTKPARSPAVAAGKGCGGSALEAARQLSNLARGAVAQPQLAAAIRELQRSWLDPRAGAVHAGGEPAVPDDEVTSNAGGWPRGRSL